MIWDAKTETYLCYQSAFQPWDKPYPDNIGANRRRVLCIRESIDGIHWSGQEPLITPDRDDPPEMEFYQFQVFPYVDRYMGLMLNYAPSPLMPSKHGPQLSTEWWISPDGRNWERPYRNLHVGPFFSAAPFCQSAMLNFLVGPDLYTLPQDRIASVGAKANAEFSSPTFTMPNKPLLINLDCHFGPGRESDRQMITTQAYVMVEVQDLAGRVIPGYEREKCLIRDVDSPCRPLVWEGRDTTALAGQHASLRFYVRDAHVYACYTK